MVKMIPLVLAVALVLPLALFQAHDFYDQYRRDQRSLQYYETTYLRQQGFAQGFGTYELRSFDGGKNWYAVEYDRDSRSLKIVGPAEQVFPGLIAHNAGMKALMDHVSKNGPIDLGQPEQVRLLTDAGFEIAKK